MSKFPPEAMQLTRFIRGKPVHITLDDTDRLSLLVGNRRVSVVYDEKAPDDLRIDFNVDPVSVRKDDS